MPLLGCSILQNVSNWEMISYVEKLDITIL